jgi:DNA-directed RNA polymerase specialized sigma24 family protein
VTELFLAGYSISEIQQMTQKPQSTVSSAVQRISELLGIKRKKCADKDLPDAA